ncbi:MAG: SCO family protein [Leptospira sp.]|nr:SCO family protein [Leptospira sp.]
MKIKKQNPFNFSILLSLIFVFCNQSDPVNKYDPSVSEFSTPQESLPFFKGRDMQPFWPEKTEIATHPELRSMKPFSLTDQAGRMNDVSDMKGNLNVVSFFFTRCGGICPKMTNHMKKVQDQFPGEKNVKLFSFSVTPDLDSPAVLKEYAEKRGIQTEKWKLLTGSRTEIYKLARESFNADTITPNEKRKGLTTNDFLHSESIYLLDKNLHIRGIYNGRIPVSIEGLIADIRALLVEDNVP